VGDGGWGGMRRAWRGARAGRGWVAGGCGVRGGGPAGLPALSGPQGGAGGRLRAACSRRCRRRRGRRRRRRRPAQASLWPPRAAPTSGMRLAAIVRHCRPSCASCSASQRPARIEGRGRGSRAVRAGSGGGAAARVGAPACAGGRAFAGTRRAPPRRRRRPIGGRARGAAAADAARAQCRPRRAAAGVKGAAARGRSGGGRSRRARARARAPWRPHAPAGACPARTDADGVLRQQPTQRARHALLGGAHVAEFAGSDPIVEAAGGLGLLLGRRPDGGRRPPRNGRPRAGRRGPGARPAGGPCLASAARGAGPQHGGCSQLGIECGRPASRRLNWGPGRLRAPRPHRSTARGPPRGPPPRPARRQRHAGGRNCANGMRAGCPRRQRARSPRPLTGRRRPRRAPRDSRSFALQPERARKRCARALLLASARR
jgi:hypothetical protein